jgi:hypothetical protein
MGDFFEIFLHGQLQQCGLTRADLKVKTCMPLEDKRMPDDISLSFFFTNPTM